MGRTPTTQFQPPPPTTQFRTPPPPRMPTFPYYLDESSTLKFAANIPYEKGYPKVSLKKYAICPHKVSRQIGGKGVLLRM